MRRCSSGCELAHENERARCLVGVLELDNVFVLQLAQHLELAHHRLVVLLVLLQALVQDLRREETATATAVQTGVVLGDGVFLVSVMRLGGAGRRLRVAPAAVPHQFDLGKMPSSYRLTFLVDLPEVFVVKQPLRSLPAGIGRTAFCEAGRRLAHAALREPGSPVALGRWLVG